jgi:hypothetical protein
VASLHSASIRRRLAVLTEAIRRRVEYREELRDKAKAWAVIRSALADANIDPTQISAVRAVDHAERALAQRGESPELRRADAAFVAQDTQLASRKSFTDRWGARAPDFAGQPPPRPGASLADWYAWSLAARAGEASDPG